MQSSKSSEQFLVSVTQKFFFVEPAYEGRRWYCLEDVFIGLEFAGMLKSRTNGQLRNLTTRVALGSEGQVNFPTGDYELLKSRHVDIAKTGRSIGKWDRFVCEGTAKTLYTLAKNLNLLLREGDLHDYASARSQLAPHYVGQRGFLNESEAKIATLLEKKINLSQPTLLYERNASLETKFYSARGGAVPCFSLWTGDENIYLHSKTITLLEQNLPAYDESLDEARMPPPPREDIATLYRSVAQNPFTAVTHSLR